MKRQQRGFTLIELVMVIVILGVLAAVALPKFVDLGSDAKTAAVQGAAGALSSYSVTNYASYLVSATSTKNIRLNAASAGAALGSSMATWDSAKFVFMTDATCAAVGGASATAKLSYNGGDSAVNTATATIICTG